MSRIVIASNRVALSKDHARTKAPAGGLAVALEEMLRETGGMWFGWSGKVSKTRARAPELTEVDGITYATLDLKADDFEEYYNGFANRTLWPLFHYRSDLTTYDRRFYKGYLRVNALFARHLAELLQPGDRLWVHDYHLIPLGRELRRLGCEHTIGFFLHIPFPAYQLLLTIPSHRALVRDLFAYDLLGFQTEGDRRALRDYVVFEAQGEGRRDTLRIDEETIQTGVFPIGIDVEEFAAIARSPVAQRQYRRTKSSMRSRKLVIGVDRLDYSKGIPERLHAFERLLEVYPKTRGSAVLMQIASPSRTGVPEYKAIRRQLETFIGNVNGRFAEPDWMPIIYLSRTYERRHLAGMYRAARVGLVTPFRDGMNLVSMEYVAAQDPEKPGVLVLSRFAGSAQNMPGALIVNPHDVQAVADAIQQGLRMPKPERVDRWERNMASLREHDLTAWRKSFMSALEGTGASLGPDCDGQQLRA